MKVRVDKTIDQMVERNRQFDTAYRIQIMTSDGTEFDISEDADTGALTVRTYHGIILISPQAANAVRLFEQRT